MFRALIINSPLVPSETSKVIPFSASSTNFSYRFIVYTSLSNNFYNGFNMAIAIMLIIPHFLHFVKFEFI